MISTNSRADERPARFQQFSATLPRDRDFAGPVVLTSAISGRARACPSRLASSIASTQPALQGAIAAFVSFCNLPQGFESFPTAAQYTSARGDSASMSRNGQRSDFTSRREAGAEPSVHLLPLSCLSYLCDDLGRVTFCLVTNFAALISPVLRQTTAAGYLEAPTNGYRAYSFPVRPSSNRALS